MLQYTLKRLLLIPPTFFLVSLAIFAVLNVAPGRPGAADATQSGESSQSSNQRESYRIFKEQFNHKGTSTSILTSKTKKPVTITHTKRIEYLVSRFKPMVIAYVNKQVKVLCKRAKLIRLIQGKELWDLASCHIFRKSFATRLYRKGVDILHIQVILCHSSIARATVRSTCRFGSAFRCNQLRRLR